MDYRHVDLLLERFLARFFSIPTRSKYVLELSFSQIKFLMAVAHREKVHLVDLSRGLNLTPASTSEMCFKLFKMGYVRQIPDMADRRIKWIVLTLKGRKMLEKISNYRTERIERLFRMIGNDGANKFIDSLLRLNDALDVWEANNKQ